MTTTAPDPLSLRNLLLGGSDLPQAEGEDKAALAEMRREIEKEVPNLSWADASEEIDNKIDAVLNQPVDEMLVGAWGKYKELQKYCDPDEYPPGRTVLTALAGHDIKALFSPSVVVSIAGIDAAKLALPIKLNLQLEGIVLKIEAGKILAVQAGSLQGVAEMRFQLRMLRPKLPPRDLFKPLKKKTEKFDFPAAIEFDEGYAIGKGQAQA